MVSSFFDYANRAILQLLALSLLNGTSGNPPVSKPEQECGILISGKLKSTLLCPIIKAENRTAGVAGTNLEGNKCPKSGSGGFDNCYAAYLNLHLTPQSTAYIEVSEITRNLLVSSSYPLSVLGRLGLAR